MRAEYAQVTAARNSRPRIPRTAAQHDKGDGMADKTVRGRFVWHELMTSDSVAAYGFYGKVLGWKTMTHEGDAAHTSFAASGGPLGNATQADEGPSTWIPYIGTT